MKRNDYHINNTYRGDGFTESDSDKLQEHMNKFVINFKLNS